MRFATWIVLTNRVKRARLRRFVALAKARTQSLFQVLDAASAESAAKVEAGRFVTQSTANGVSSTFAEPSRDNGIPTHPDLAESAEELLDVYDRALELLGVEEADGDTSQVDAIHAQMRSLLAADSVSELHTDFSLMRTVA